MIITGNKCCNPLKTVPNKPEHIIFKKFYYEKLCTWGLGQWAREYAVGNIFQITK
jgi:hypothetical protein